MAAATVTKMDANRGRGEITVNGTGEIIPFHYADVQPIPGATNAAQWSASVGAGHALRVGDPVDYNKNDIRPIKPL